MPSPLQPGTQELQVSSCGVRLSALLVHPAGARGLVIVVHGSGSNRLSPRNQAVAAVLQQAGLATVMVDLLTPVEQDNLSLGGSAGPGLEASSRRLAGVIEPLQAELPLLGLPVGLFGASSGAAVALAVAAQSPQQIRAVVCRGGRPDLVPGSLGDVRCPTLLLVGSLDLDILELNTWAAARLQSLHELRVVPGAGHLFAEPGTLDCVAAWTREWFLRHLLR